jgi:hypothetical protein
MTDPKNPKKKNKKKKYNNDPYSLKEIQKSYPNAIAVYPRKNSLGSTVMFKGGGTVSLNRGRYTQKQESLASAINKVINKK